MKILDFPNLRQTYEYDCGAKAIQSILVYYGIDISEEVILKKVKTSEKGTKITNIENFFNECKLSIDSRKMKIEDIKKYIDKNTPVLLLLQAWSEKKEINWENNWKDGHYVVAIGYDKNKIYFEDPYSFKKAFLTYLELEERWHDQIQNKQYIHHGIAIFGKFPNYKSDAIVHMD